MTIIQHAKQNLAAMKIVMLVLAQKLLELAPNVKVDLDMTQQETEEKEHAHLAQEMKHQMVQ